MTHNLNLALYYYVLYLIHGKCNHAHAIGIIILHIKPRETRTHPWEHFVIMCYNTLSTVVERHESNDAVIVPRLPTVGTITTSLLSCLSTTMPQNYHVIGLWFACLYTATLQGYRVIEIYLHAQSRPCRKATMYLRSTFACPTYHGHTDVTMGLGIIQSLNCHFIRSGDV